MPDTGVMDGQQKGSRLRERNGAVMRVLIADDDRHAREGLSAFLRTYQGIEVVREVEDGRAAIELAESVRPDVVMLDLKITAVDGIEVTRVIKARMPEVVVIILTMESVQRDVALAAGADAFVSKGAPPRDLGICMQVPQHS